MDREEGRTEDGEEEEDGEGGEGAARRPAHRRRACRRRVHSLNSSLRLTLSSTHSLDQSLQSRGNPTGPQLDVPTSITPQQCQTLLRGLLEGQGDEEASTTPYSFYLEFDGEDGSKEADVQQLDRPLRDHLRTMNVSVETVVKLIYRPQAVFRVRPVTRCSATIPGHEDSILCVHFAPDGKGLCTGGGDKSVRFWNLNTQTPKFTCRGHVSHVLSVQWSPDAALVASGDRQGGVWVWDAATGKAVGGARPVRRWLL